jgi:hypothetical protein
MVELNCPTCKKKVILKSYEKHTCGSSVVVCDTGGVTLIGNVEDSSIIYAAETKGN